MILPLFSIAFVLNSSFVKSVRKLRRDYAVPW